MENEILRTAAKRLAGKMNRYTRKEGLELQKMELGMEIILINVSKLIIIYTLAAWLGVLWQTLTVHSAFILIKRYSFGLHALNSTVCTLISCLMFVVAPMMLNGVGISNVGVAAAFLVIISVLYRYAPADTKARPLIGTSLRALLKRKTVVCGLIVMAAALLVPNEAFKLLLVLGAAFQSISILPLTYKILKRSEKNYEAYECA